MKKPRLIARIESSLLLKIAIALILGLFFCFAMLCVFLVPRTTAMLESGLVNQGKAMATGGAQTMSQILETAIQTHQLTVDDVFDDHYVPIPNTSPTKYHTRFDAFTDRNFQAIEDSFLTDPQVLFAVAVDRNGYLPTHDSRYCQPLTGNPKKDLEDNRTKRIFNDPVGLRAARNTDGVLVQFYPRDTGEKVWDISAPITVEGRHWGAFRVGLSQAVIKRQVQGFLMMFVLVGGGVSLLLSVWIIVLLWFALKPLPPLLQTIQAIAAGDLDKRVDIRTQDEVGRIAVNLAKMSASLKQVVGSARHAAKVVEEGVHQVTASVEGMSTALESQASSMQESSSSITEIVVSIQNVSGQVSNANQVASSAFDTAQQGRQTVEQVVNGMAKLNDTMSEVVSVMEALGRSSAEIGAIVELIDDIAKQTNLLALNATIEAARAGENGRGFAVVADEVRQLAKRSTDATSNIAKLIKGIQSEMGRATQATKQGEEVLQEELKLAANAGESLQAIVEAVGEARSLMDLMTRAIKEQDVATKHILSATESMHLTAQESTASIEQIIGSAFELMVQANQLVETIAFFQDKEPLSSETTESSKESDLLLPAS